MHPFKRQRRDPPLHYEDEHHAYSGPITRPLHPLPGLSSFLLDGRERNNNKRDDAVPRPPLPRLYSSSSHSGDAAPIQPLHTRVDRFRDRSDSIGSFESTFTDNQSTTIEDASPVGKSSRYLREIDRRTILQRIDGGERQAALAKEYHVSRAAICNLNKHRDVVLSRKDENPLSKHPKKPRSSKQHATVSKMRVTSKASELIHHGAVVYELKSRSIALLLTTLRDIQTSDAEFRRCGSRLLRLLVEEALALAPHKNVQVLFNAHARIDGVATEFPPCGITMDRFGGDLLLGTFQMLEPHRAIGSIRQSPMTGEMTLDMAHDLRHRSVFLFELVAYSVGTLCDAVEQLIARGASEDRIWLVALGVSYHGIELIHTRLPALKVVTVVVDRSSMNQKQQDPSSPCLKPDLRLEILANRFMEVLGTINRA